MHLMNRLIIGISGASGVIYGIRLLEMLKDAKDIETHLVVHCSVFDENTFSSG